MKLVTPAQMKELDRISIEEYGIPGIVLMENAALRIADEAEKMLDGIRGRHVCVLAGKGNNGGDAFACARHLFNRGFHVCVYLLAGRQEIKGDAAVNLHVIDRLGIKVFSLPEGVPLEVLEQELKRADLILDGILGTGVRGEVQGIMREVICRINLSGKPVLSIDIPSGVCGETGKILGAAVKASKTVTFALPKTGLVVCPARSQAGELVVAEIGIPGAAVTNMGIKTEYLTRPDVSSLIPSRALDSNKGDFGRVLLITGSTGMTGAGCLAAKAALRSGAGLVYMAVPSSLAHLYDFAVTEAMVLPLEDCGKGHICAVHEAQLDEYLSRKTAVAIGPGLGMSEGARDLVLEVIRRCEVPLVLDADALNGIASDVSILSCRKADTVITPHPGEMARLTGMTIEQVQEDRMAAAREFTARWGVITVLKGAGTVVAVPDGRVFVNSTGNPGMATGGTGDVLAGLIAGLAGQGMLAADAAAAGVYLHGLAGDLAACEKGWHSLIAGDVIEKIPEAFRELGDR